MESERWRQIERLYDAALERDANGRAAFLIEACAGDDELRRKVESLLAVHEQAGSFMAAPALEIAARLIAGDQGEAMLPYPTTHLPEATCMLKNAQNRHRFQRALFKNRTHKCSLVTKVTFGFRVVFHCRLAFRIFRRFQSVLFIIGETWK